MTLKNAIATIPGFRFMTEYLDLRSSLARHILPGMEWSKESSHIRAELSRVETVIGTISRETSPGRLHKIVAELAHLKDIRGTVSRLADGKTLNDVELYELKAFALGSSAIKDITDEIFEDMFEIPDTESIVTLLDPENTRIPHFYIYDSYSDHLKKLRAEYGEAKKATNPETESLFRECAQAEESVRKELSNKLRQYSDIVYEALLAVADVDILLAKSRQALEMNLCKPEPSLNKTMLKGIFNPEIDRMLRKTGKSFQPVDITIGQYPTLISGANMGGKTVVLQTVALIQALFQFGFYVPAAMAELTPVDEITTIIGEPERQAGLSSFASEIVRLNELTEKILGGKNVLALIDEPARTTNPEEGKAIVGALLEFLTEHNVESLVTSHFSGIPCGARRLRVKGLDHRTDLKNVTPANIQDYMDYSLVGDENGEVPHEALNIARILGMNTRITDTAESIMERG